MIEIHDMSPAISFTSHAALQASNSDHRMNGYPPHFISAFLTWVIAFEIFPLPPCLPISLRTDLCSVAQRGSSRRVASCCSYDLVAQVSGDVETVKQRICNSGEDAGYRGWEGGTKLWRCLVIHSNCIKETARLQSDSQCIPTSSILTMRLFSTFKSVIQQTCLVLRENLPEIDKMSRNK